MKETPKDRFQEARENAEKETKEYLRLNEAINDGSEQSPPKTPGPFSILFKSMNLKIRRVFDTKQ